MCLIRKYLPIVLSALASQAVFADGIYVNGTGARAMSMGGADVAYAIDPLGAMGENPAGLASLARPSADFGFLGGFGQGTFLKSPYSDGSLNSGFQGLPNGAFTLPVNPNITVGFSSTPTSALNADWTYVDPPGGLGGKTSYGNQVQHSEIVVIRNAAGVGLKINQQLSVGASFGLDYNRNLLQAPYIFQSQPAVKGAKTLLDLKTDGFGFDGQIGALYKLQTNLSLGLTYQTPSQVESRGSASGNVGAQFGAASIPFNYRAKVRNTFPEEVNLGLSWGFHPQWRAAVEIDWIDWANAFRTLPVDLSEGSSATVNGVTGSSHIQDNVPLDWKSEFVYRGGLEYEVVPNLFLRGGYCHGGSPVPDQTLSPLTAAITENTFTCGVGYKWKLYTFDLSYQYDLPITRDIGSSGLLSGEYSNSSVKVNLQWVALTIGATF